MKNAYQFIGFGPSIERRSVFVERVKVVIQERRADRQFVPRFPFQLAKEVRVSPFDVPRRRHYRRRRALTA